MNLTTHLHLVLKLKMSGVIPLLTLCAFMACTQLTVCLSFNITKEFQKYKVAEGTLQSSI